jgi:hypothetical protein
MSCCITILPGPAKIIREYKNDVSGSLQLIAEVGKCDNSLACNPRAACMKCGGRRTDVSLLHSRCKSSRRRIKRNAVTPDQLLVLKEMATDALACSIRGAANRRNRSIKATVWGSAVDGSCKRDRCPGHELQLYKLISEECVVASE